MSKKPASIAERMAALRAANKPRPDRRTCKHDDPKAQPEQIGWQAWHYRCSDFLGEAWQPFRPIPSHIDPATFVNSGTYTDLWRYMQLRRLGVHGWIRSWPYIADNGVWKMMPFNTWHPFQAILEGRV